MKMVEQQRQALDQDATEDQKRFYLPKPGLKSWSRQWLTAQWTEKTPTILFDQRKGLQDVRGRNEEASERS